MSLRFATIPQKRLLAGITSASSTFYVNNILSFDGLTNVLPADLGTQHYCAFRNDTGTILELCEIDPATISAGPITLLKRGLSFYGNLTTQTTALKLDWPSNSLVMFGSDLPQIFQWLKEYIDGIAIAGSPDASTTAKGLAEEATQAEVDAGTAAGSAARLFQNPATIRAKKYHDYAASAVGTDAYAITISPAITAYSAGQVFTFKADVANTTDATLNVSGLGAKAIVKNVTTALETGDILANQIVMVEYDGTNMQIVSFMSGIKKTDVQIFTSSGTWTKPDLAKSVQVICISGGGGGGNGILASPTSGGSGGGGGVRKIEILNASNLSATETVTVGAAGMAGGTGGTSSFGSWVTSTGGGGGRPGQAGNFNYGGTGASTGVGTATTNGIAGQGANVNTGAGADGYVAEWGGGAGGGSVNSAEGKAGGSSIFSAPGGGGGGGRDVGSESTGEAGGKTNSYTVAGGGAGGAVRTAGTAGTSNSGSGYCGTAGGGGGGSMAGSSGAGGAGGTPGGGGGGGGSGASAGTAGIGGKGEIVVITYF